MAKMVGFGKKKRRRDLAAAIELPPNASGKSIRRRLKADRMKARGIKP